MWGAKFRYTTEWNGIVNMFIGIPCHIFGLVFLWFGVTGLFPSAANGPKSILFGFGCLFGSAWLLDKIGIYLWLNTLSTWLHLRRNLEIPVTWEDASRLQNLFLADSEGRFHTLGEIKKLDLSLRREQVIEFAKSIGRYSDA